MVGGDGVCFVLVVLWCFVVFCDFCGVFCVVLCCFASFVIFVGVLLCVVCVVCDL